MDPPGPDEKRAKVRRLQPRMSRPTTSQRTPTGLDEEAIHAAARKAVARMPQAGGRVRIACTVEISVEEAELLTARAIREGKSLRGLIADLVRAAAGEQE
jgi:hypothetical protein